VTAIERSGVAAPSLATSNGAADIAGRLASVRGLGDARVQQLLATFGSEEALRAATIDDLQRVNGVGPQLAERIRAALDAQVALR